jgi:hypothetical protein
MGKVKESKFDPRDLVIYGREMCIVINSWLDAGEAVEETGMMVAHSGGVIYLIRNTNNEDHLVEECEIMKYFPILLNLN